MTYLVYEIATGLVVNAIAYDGEAPYEPGDGLALCPWDEVARPWVGWTRNEDGSFTPPADTNDSSEVSA